MAVFAANPRMQFFDLNGDPLSGGFVYTYEVTTTTNKATYPTLADAVAGTNANANPIELDSKGETVICLTGPTKFVVKDSTLSTIETTDNYYPSSNGSVYDSNNKLILTLTATASAVNSVEVKNNSTGVNAEINAKGEATRGLTFRDSNGNELFRMTSMAAAVNFIDFTNSATGVACTMTLSGDDTNIGYFIQPKGTGVVGILGTADSAAELRLYEDTDNGSNYIGFKAPASIATSYTMVYPTGPGSSTQKLTSDGATPITTLTWS